jgi:RND family efflux transporter MFP subunit
MHTPGKLFQFIRRQPRWRLIATAALLALIGFLVWGRGVKSSGKSPTFAARRGPLEITVLEGGSLQALESQEIKCEVRVGYNGTKILKIVDEGYFVTEEDVKTNKILVELDSSDFEKQIVQQEIQYQTALANLTDSEQGYEIQLGQNQSDISAAEQKARFARLDFDKFLGDKVTAQIIQQVGLDVVLAAAITNNVEDTARAQEVSSRYSDQHPNSSIQSQPALEGVAGQLHSAVLRSGSTNSVATTPSPALLASSSGLQKRPEEKRLLETLAAPPPTKVTIAGAAVSSPSLTTKGPSASDAEMLKSIAVDFSKYSNIDALGDGEAKQKLRKFDDDLQVAQKELEQAKTRLEGTRRLFEKAFVTKTELQQDDIAFENSRLKVVTAETARDLFLKYDFLKSAEEFLSKYAEAVREFDKARRVAVSRIAQARAKLNSAQGQYEVQTRQLKDLKDQVAKCTLRAQKSGLVVYGGSRDDMVYYGNQEPIREGATVRERQAIITIPDMSRMAVNVKILECYIKKVKKGQKARITVDAFPDTMLTGEVTKVGVLPDSGNRWMNPDMKVYLTAITIDGSYDWIKPGMSAKVEILVNKLDDCVYVPVQAVAPDGGKQICYVANGLKHERREIQIGQFNDDFIEVKKGLKEGERILLRAPGAPEAVEPEKPAGDQKAPPNEKRPAPVPTSVTTSKAG